MGTVFRTAMFITSFLPLWVTIIIKNIAATLEGKETNRTVAIAVVAVIVITIFVANCIMWGGLSAVKRRPSDKVTMKQATREKTLTTEYLLAYILPLFVFDFTSGWEVVQFLVYFLALAFLCIRNGNVYANILLELRGYRFYNCQVFFHSAQGVREVTILSRSNLDSQTYRGMGIGVLNKPVYLDVN